LNKGANPKHEAHRVKKPLLLKNSRPNHLRGISRGNGQFLTNIENLKMNIDNLKGDDDDSYIAK
jgi:hypothetical protein